MKKQLVAEKAWVGIPEELILEIMKEMPQEHLLLLFSWPYIIYF